MTRHEDEPLPPELAEAAKAYHEPPATPREEMWRRIETVGRSDGRTAGAWPKLAVRPAGRQAVWFGVAALLALAFAIGRIGVRSPAAPGVPARVASGPAPVPGREAYRIAAVEHLAQAEAFLTLFRVAVRQGRQEPLAPPTARYLLATNRLLLDSPAATDPRLKLLLEDLELVLVGIAQLAPERQRQDLDLITDGLDRSGMLVRLRAAVPAGDAPPPPRQPGAL
ncbi:MAG TPA: hypothetical protein VFU46_04525 [Gemmatimonadales bacterium]|nr:hypothetical protein [Gemmatimonadales bacterium]